MTNLEAIKHFIGSKADLSDERLAIAAGLVGLDPAATYDNDDQQNKCRAYGVAISEISQDKGVAKITQSGYSVEYNSDITAGLLSLANDSGCASLIALFTTGNRSIKNASRKW